MSESALHAQAMRTYYSMRGVRFLTCNAVAHHVLTRNRQALAELVMAYPDSVPAVIGQLAGNPRHEPVLSVLCSMLARVVTQEALHEIEGEML